MKYVKERKKIKIKESDMSEVCKGELKSQNKGKVIGVKYVKERKRSK